MDNFTVYMHINRINGKKYIGITSQPPKGRWRNGKGYKGQRRFYAAIKSYGWENFDHVILFTGLTKEEAESKEVELIKEHRSNNLSYGYNIENGGVIHKLSEEQKEHLRKINTGKKHSSETKQKISDSHKGLSRQWLIGRKHTEETKHKMSVSRSGGRNPKAKPIYQYDLLGNLVAEYDCMESAKNSLGIKSTSHISRCCAGKRGKAYGSMWSFSKEKKEPYARLWKGGIVHG